jgi:hypothetical protein
LTFRTYVPLKLTCPELLTLNELQTSDFKPQTFLLFNRLNVSRVIPR